VSSERIARENNSVIVHRLTKSWIHRGKEIQSDAENESIETIGIMEVVSHEGSVMNIASNLI
jgi:hypothetical protein